MITPQCGHLIPTFNNVLQDFAPSAFASKNSKICSAQKSNQALLPWHTKAIAKILQVTQKAIATLPQVAQAILMIAKVVRATAMSP